MKTRSLLLLTILSIFISSSICCQPNILEAQTSSINLVEWKYRRLVNLTITGYRSDGSMFYIPTYNTSLPIRIELVINDTDIDNSFNSSYPLMANFPILKVTLPSLVKPDFSDVIFVDYYTMNPLYYYFEAIYYGNRSFVWVAVPFKYDPTTHPNYTLLFYIYYGNPNGNILEQYHDPTKIFPLFDEFEQPSINNTLWDVVVDQSDPNSTVYIEEGGFLHMKGEASLVLKKIFYNVSMIYIVDFYIPDIDSTQIKNQSFMLRNDTTGIYHKDVLTHNPPDYPYTYYFEGYNGANYYTYTSLNIWNTNEWIEYSQIVTYDQAPSGWRYIATGSYLGHFYYKDVFLYSELTWDLLYAMTIDNHNVSFVFSISVGGNATNNDPSDPNGALVIDRILAYYYIWGNYTVYPQEHVNDCLDVFVIYTYESWFPLGVVDDYFYINGTGYKLVNQTIPLQIDTYEFTIYKHYKTTLGYDAYVEKVVFNNNEYLVQDTQLVFTEYIGDHSTMYIYITVVFPYNSWTLPYTMTTSIPSPIVSIPGAGMPFEILVYAMLGGIAIMLSRIYSLSTVLAIIAAFGLALSMFFLSIENVWIFLTLLFLSLLIRYFRGE